jgi:putative intracellular protease/amidase
MIKITGKIRVRECVNMKVAFLAVEGTAVWQVTLLQKFLRDAGLTIRTLTPGGQPVTTDGGLHLRPDVALEHATPRDYDVLLMAGQDITVDNAEDPQILRFLRQFAGHGGWIAASCASAVYLGAAGLLGGLRFTSMPNVVKEFESYFAKSIYEDMDVCVDGNIITSKGYAHFEFMMAVCRQLGLTRDPHFERIAHRLGRNQ